MYPCVPGNTGVKPPKTLFDSVNVISLFYLIPAVSLSDFFPDLLKTTLYFANLDSSYLFKIIWFVLMKINF